MTLTPACPFLGDTAPPPHTPTPGISYPSAIRSLSAAVLSFHPTVHLLRCQRTGHTHTPPLPPHLPHLNITPQDTSPGRHRRRDTCWLYHCAMEQDGHSPGRFHLRTLHIHLPRYHTHHTLPHISPHSHHAPLWTPRWWPSLRHRHTIWFPFTHAWVLHMPQATPHPTFTPFPSCLPFAHPIPRATRKRKNPGPFTYIHSCHFTGGVAAPQRNNACWELGPPPGLPGPARGFHYPHARYPDVAREGPDTVHFLPRRNTIGRAAHGRHSHSPDARQRA